MPVNIRDPPLVRFDDTGQTGRWGRRTQVPEK